MRWFCIILFVFSFFCRTYSQAPPGWFKVNEKNRITFYQKDTVKNIKQFKAAFTIDASMPIVESFVLDVKNYKHWISAIEKIKRIDLIQTEYKYYHLFIELKPFIEREGIVRLNENTGVDSSQFEIELDTVAFQHKLNATAIKYFRITWQLIPVSQTQTEIKLYHLGYIDEYNNFVYSIIDKVILLTLKNMTKDFIETVEK